MFLYYLLQAIGINVRRRCKENCEVENYTPLLEVFHLKIE